MFLLLLRIIYFVPLIRQKNLHRNRFNFGSDDGLNKNIGIYQDHIYIPTKIYLVISVFPVRLHSINIHDKQLNFPLF